MPIHKKTIGFPHKCHIPHILIAVSFSLLLSSTLLSAIPSTHTMTADTRSTKPEPDAAEEDASGAACVMSFNANDASGSSGLGCDIATICAMGVHPLPVVTAIIIRDTAEVFDHSPIDEDIITEQARSVLEDIPLSAWKVGFLGSPEGVSAVAEILSDYPDVPLIAYMPNLAWLEEDQQQPYLDAFRELILPQTEILVGSHQTLTNFLLPDWPSEQRSASPRELAVAANEHGTAMVLVTSIPLPDQCIDNVLASPQGPIVGEKFERFEANFVGAGETLSASLAALIGTGIEPHTAVAEALAFLDQALDNGFRPGMGHAIPDRFFWAAPDDEDEEGDNEDEASAQDADTKPPRNPRHVH
jgi:hydroxymethylpyrimidine/phosphomethylpyrimidine kinase